VTVSVLDRNKLQELVFFLVEAYFPSCGNVNSQNERHWCYENAHEVYEVPLHALTIRKWCWGACVLMKQFSVSC
jgi:hypothetical protein